MAKVEPYDGRHDEQFKTLIELIGHKASEHRDKGDWVDVPLATLINGLHDEMDELDVALESNNMIDTLREIGDVGMYLVMIAETLMRHRTLHPTFALEDTMKVENIDIKYDPSYKIHVGDPPYMDTSKPLGKRP